MLRWRPALALARWRAIGFTTLYLLGCGFALILAFLGALGSTDFPNSADESSATPLWVAGILLVMIAIACAPLLGAILSGGRNAWPGGVAGIAFVATSYLLAGTMNRHEWLVVGYAGAWMISLAFADLTTMLLRATCIAPWAAFALAQPPFLPLFFVFTPIVVGVIDDMRDRIDSPWPTLD